jgi:4-hydroxyphenylacetate 3-monooxygenase
MATVEAEKTLLKSGEEYKESLRDGREVWYQGERIEDVTTHPVTSQGIEFTAGLYDAQLEPETQDVLSYIRPEDGARVSTSWIEPRTQEDLDRARLETEYRAWEAFGAFTGRNPDMIPWTARGFYFFAPRHAEWDPEHAGNIQRYFTYAQDNNVHIATAMVEAQGKRSRAAQAGDEREGCMKIVKQDSEGVWFSGTKVVGTCAPQCNELIIGDIYYPNIRDNEAHWMAVPVNSPGLKFITKEATQTRAGASTWDHPLARIGEEVDTLVVADELFVPHWRIWSLDPRSCDPALYSMSGAGEQWQLLVRLCIKGEFLAGLAQMIVDTLDTSAVPSVRESVGKVTEYARILRCGVMAAQAMATMSEGGILMPAANICSSVRSYGMQMHPVIVHLVQEMCGQGLVVRFSEKDFAHPDLGRELDLFLESTTVSAREKNLVMNLVWDVTCSDAAGRSQVFENVNGLPAFLHRQFLYSNFDRKPWVNRIRGLIGLPEA